MSACNLSADITVATLVDCLLPRFGSQNGPKFHIKGKPSKALYVSLDLRLSDYSGDEEQCESRIVHLIFERPSNYTKVWAAVDRGIQISQPGVFTMRSDHDSCWRSDGLRDIQGACFEMLKALRAKNPDVAPSEFCTIHKVAWVEVEYEPIDLCNEYRKRLTSITEKESLTGR